MSSITAPLPPQKQQRSVRRKRDVRRWLYPLLLLLAILLSCVLMRHALKRHPFTDERVGFQQSSR